MIVNLYQFSQPLGEAPPAQRLVTMLCMRPSPSCLLVRQQLQRINQMSAKALRYCMRSEDPGLINTFPCLHHQEPVWLLPIVVFLRRSRTTNLNAVSPRDPPNAVFHWETVTMRDKYNIVTPPCLLSVGAMMRRRYSVLLIMISWTVLSVLASSFATFSKASFILSKGPFRDTHFSECVF